MQNKDIFWLGKSEKVAQIACRGRGNLGNAQNKRCFFFWEGLPYLQENYIKSEW